jgi:hypothetical protein
MFMISEFDPQVIYTAEACGLISRIDLRSESATTTLFKNKRKFYGSNTAKLSSVKAIAQSRTLGEHSLIFGGQGVDIRQIDTRMIDIEGDRSATKGIIRQWGPHFLSDRQGTAKPMLSAAMSHTSFRRQCERGTSLYQGSLSLSGLQISSNGRMMVASYQGDQIYTFDLFGRAEQELIQEYFVPTKPPSIAESESSSSPCVASKGTATYSNGFTEYGSRVSNWDSISFSDVSPVWSTAARKKEGLRTGSGVGATGVFGGHQNYQTFLKQVSFFGPKDEYIVSGSDSGDMFVWETKSGTMLVDTEKVNFPKGWGEFCSFLK